MLSEFLQDTVHILYLFYIRQRFSGLSLHNRTVKQQKKILRLHPDGDSHSSLHKVRRAFREVQGDQGRRQLHVSDARIQ